MRTAIALSLLCLAACGDNTRTAPIELGAMAPLSGPEGRGGFRFGASSAATQIEDMNPTTDWYAFTAPTDIGGLGNGTFVGDASQGFTRAFDDVELVTRAGLESYRFSIEWARVEPQRDVIDEAALAHYGELLDRLIAAGVRPMVTVHHFSNPAWVDDPSALDCPGGPGDTNLCGLGHPVGGPLVVAEMEEHARLLAERFGDRVDEWGTINEPVNYLLASYGIGVFPPGKNNIFDLLDGFMPVVRDYLGAHAAMYHAIKEADTIDADGDGRAATVGMTLSVAEWVATRDNQVSTDPQDTTARDRLSYVFHHLVPTSVIDGTFDSDVDGVADEMQPTWQGTLDWLGLQYYFRAGVTGKTQLIGDLELTPCFGDFNFGSCLPIEDPTWCVPEMGYEFYAPGVANLLVEFGERYPDLPLVVTESGLATDVGQRRSEHVVRTLEQIGAAIDAGVDVRGYYHWSLFDNFEWAEGFGPRFGLYRVDYDTFERTPTAAVAVLKEIAAARAVSTSLREELGGTGPMTPETDRPAQFCGDLAQESP